MPRRRNGSVVSLFSGLGGLDLGAHVAGLRVGIAIDADGTALDCLNQALGARTVQGLTQELNPEEVIASLGQHASGEAILIGGPPCTAFSHAGFWLKRKRDGSDHQSRRIDDYWRYVVALRPRAFVLENVPGLTFRNHRATLEAFERKARRSGYSITSTILDSARFGVPQARRRLFVVGLRSRARYTFPSGSFPLESPRSSGWAIGDLTARENPAEPDEILRGRYAPYLRKVPPGDNYLYFTKERGHRKPAFGWRRRYWSFLLKLDPRQPSPTLAATRVTNNGPFHWENRRLRVRELARLQGFPDAYPLADDWNLARRHLGNAVPPLVAAQLLWHLQVYLGERSRTDVPETILQAVSPDASAVDVSQALASALQPGCANARERRERRAKTPTRVHA